MPHEITDEMLETFAVSASPRELPDKIMARYEGLLDRLSLYAPFVPGENEVFWRNLVEAIHARNQQS